MHLNIKKEAKKQQTYHYYCKAAPFIDSWLIYLLSNSQKTGSFRSGFIKFVVSYSLFRKMFTVFVIPMLNPDGVIHGNSRTNIQGYDLNRCWTRYGAFQSRECQNIWKFLELITEKGTKIHWSLDLHGHSR